MCVDTGNNSNCHREKQQYVWRSDVHVTRQKIISLLEVNRKPKIYWDIKNKGIPRQAEVVLGVPGRLRPRVFSTFGNTRVVGRQLNAPAAFTPGEIPGTHIQRLNRPQGTWFCRKEPRKKSQVTPPGIDPGTVRLVAQRLNQVIISSCLTFWRKLD